MAEALDPGAAAERALALSREATSLRDAGRLDEAIARYREVLVLSPGHARTLFRLANTLRLKGDVVGAEQFFRSALAADPSSDGAAVNLADLLDHEGRSDTAETTTQFERQAAHQTGDETAAEGVASPGGVDNFLDLGSGNLDRATIASLNPATLFT